MSRMMKAIDIYCGNEEHRKLFPSATWSMVEHCERKVMDQLKKEIEECAIQEDAPIYEGDKEADYFVRLSDVINVLEKDCPGEMSNT